MKIAATADIHCEQESIREAVRELARRMLGVRADALMLLGDTFAGDEALLDECLALFEPFPGPKLLCAGNHDLWTTRDGPDSRGLMEEVIPRVARGRGFHVLEEGPLVHDGVAFLGGCGWYDYGFRDEGLNIPLEFYRLKFGPGALHRMDPSHKLDLPWDELEDRHYAITSVWQDGVYVRWGAEDGEISDGFVERLRRDLAAVEAQAEAIVYGAHHIPFAEMVTRKASANWNFANAFMGSPKTGEALLASPKVRFAVFGHSHVVGRRRVGHVEAVNVGSTYERKRFVTLEV